MWDIIFPGSPRPSSPYIDGDLSEEVCELMEFASAHGPAIMAAEIQASIQAGGGDPGIPAEQPEQLAGFLKRVITPRCVTLIFERWLAQRASLQPGAAAHSPVAGPSHHAPPGPSRDQSTSNATSSTRQDTPESSGSCPNSVPMPDHTTQDEQDALASARLPSYGMPSDFLRTQDTGQEQQDGPTLHPQPQQAVPSNDFWWSGDGFGQQEDRQEEWVGQQDGYGQEQVFVGENWENFEFNSVGQQGGYGQEEVVVGEDWEQFDFNSFDDSTSRASGVIGALVLDGRRNST